MKTKKSYYKPKAKKTTKATVVKKKSYYKPKKKTAKATSTVKKSYYKSKKKGLVVIQGPGPTLTLTTEKLAVSQGAKKKYKSYYKSKKQREHEAVVKVSLDKARKNPKDVGSALIPPRNVKVLSEAETNAEFAKHPISTVSKTNMNKDVIPSKRPVKYLNNKDLLAQVIMSKKNGKMTNELAKMLQLLTLRYGKKGNFANYTYNDDMQSYAMLMIVKTWNGFDPAKSSNPFAWFTQCIKNSFIQYLNYEKRQRDIRDEVLVDSGMLPSFNYQHEYAEEHKAEGPVDNDTVELPAKPSHNDVTFEVPEEDDVPVEVLQY